MDFKFLFSLFFLCGNFSFCDETEFYDGYQPEYQAVSDPYDSSINKYNESLENLEIREAITKKEKRFYTILLVITSICTIILILLLLYIFVFNALVGNFLLKTTWNLAKTQKVNREGKKILLSLLEKLDTKENLIKLNQIQTILNSKDNQNILEFLENWSAHLNPDAAGELIEKIKEIEKNLGKQEPKPHSLIFFVAMVLTLDELYRKPESSKALSQKAMINLINENLQEVIEKLKPEEKSFFKEFCEKSSKIDAK